MGFALEIQRLNKSPQAAPEWTIQFESTDGYPPVRQEETATHHRYLIGRIYEKTPETLKNLEEEFAARNTPPPRTGRFLFVSFEKQSGHLRIWADKYRLLGGFIALNNDRVTISNDQLLCNPTLLHFDQLDMRAVTDLLLYGYVQPPLTLFTNAQMILGKAEADVGEPGLTQQDWSPHWPSSDPSRGSPALEPLFDAFSHATANLMDHWQPPTFRMSGGIDTRLICSDLSPAHRSTLRHEVVCAPYLDASEDRDVLGAQLVAQELGISLHVLHQEPATSSYFGALPDHRPALGGLYGGEFLGGLLLNEDYARVATGFETIAEVKDQVRIAEPWVQDSRARFKAAATDLGMRRHLTAIYLSSFRSAIYRSIFLGWSTPYKLGQIALSPFVEPLFLDQLLQVHDADISEYSLYRKIVQAHMPKSLRKIPLSSPIVDPQAGLSGFTQGRDPKFRPSLSETAEPVFEPQLRALLRARGLEWDQVPSEERLSLRLMNLQNGLRDQLPQKTSL